MYLFSGVTIDGEDSASSRSRSTLAVMPSTVRSARIRLTLASSRIDSSTLRAISGSVTFSSKLPVVPAKVTAASLPMTCAATCTVASGITGFTLPGMIELPGCRSGRLISPRPVRGPEPIQRRSLAIFTRPTAMVLSWPEASTRGSRQLDVVGERRDDGGGQSRRGVDAGADAGAAQRELTDAGERRLQPLDPVA